LPLISILLIVLSAVTHASWNLFAKKDKSSISYFFLSNVAGLLVFSPILFLFYNKLTYIPHNVWVLVFITGFFQAIYYSSLAYAYQKGEMSFVYPVVRSLPVLIIILFMISTGRVNEISSTYILGAVLILLGIFGQSLKEIDINSIWSTNNNLLLLFSFMAAIGITGYSIIDEKALKILKLSDYSFQFTAPLIYMFFEGFSTSFWLAVQITFSKKERLNLYNDIKCSKKKYVLTGIGVYFTYLLVLFSMMFAKNVSYIIAFRQISIPIGAIFGVLILKEKVDTLKIIGISSVFLGLIFVAIK